MEEISSLIVTHQRSRIIVINTSFQIEFLGEYFTRLSFPDASKPNKIQIEMLELYLDRQRTTFGSILMRLWV